MARRRIGKEDLIARPEPRAASSLAELAALLDWAEIDRHLAGISAAAKGELGWPPLALFRGLYPSILRPAPRGRRVRAPSGARRRPLRRAVSATLDAAGVAAVQPALPMSASLGSGVSTSARYAPKSASMGKTWAAKAARSQAS